MSTARILPMPARGEQRPEVKASAWQRSFVLVEVVLLAIVAALTIAVKIHQGPFPGDAGFEIDVQHWIRPQHALTTALDSASTINWPQPAAIIVAGSAALLLALRRWLDAITMLSAVIAADGADYFISKWVHRARPADHGLYIARKVTTSFSFPSDHVLHATLTYGLLLFFTFQVARSVDRWIWPLRLVFLVIILTMGPSRILEGEHWPSDIVGGWLYGIFWLALAIHAYGWAAVRWPKLRGHAVLRHPASSG